MTNKTKEKPSDVAEIMAALKATKLKYLKIDFNRHGNLRVMVRRDDKYITLKSDPRTPEFFMEYGRALGELSSVAPIQFDNEKDTLAWLIEEYLKSPRYLTLAELTKSKRKNILRHVAQEFGDLNIHQMNCYDIEKIRAVNLREGKPHAAEHRRKDLMQVFKEGRSAGHTMNDPFIGVESAKDNPALRGQAHVGPDGKTYSGYWTWTEEQVAEFFEYWPLGTTPHVCMSLLFYLGIRIGDAQQLGPRNVEEDRMIWTTQKRVGPNRQGVNMNLPILPELQVALDAAKESKIISLDHFVLTQYGKPFSRKSLAMRFSHWADQAGLPKICSAHGVRKALATILANQEATTEELKATFGWSTSKQADVYTAQANKTKLGTSGLERIRNSSGAPAPSKMVHPSD